MNRLLAGMTVAALAVTAVVAAPAAQRLYDFKATAIDGTPLPLAQFKGKVVLLVNTASECGFRQQLSDLQTLYKAYGSQGFTVIAVPSGDFRNQEKATNKEVAETCQSLFGVRYPMTEKDHVIGPDANPLFKWSAAVLGDAAVPKWNFHKILIGRDGRPITAFPTRVNPTSPEVAAAIQAALNAKS
jgi:glutathione peroxidase